MNNDPKVKLDALLLKLKQLQGEPYDADTNVYVSIISKELKFVCKELGATCNIEYKEGVLIVDIQPAVPATKIDITFNLS